MFTDPTYMCQTRLIMKQQVDKEELIDRLKGEVLFTVSRSSGPGGQHVNTTNSRATAIWQINFSNILSLQQKDLLSINLSSRLNSMGEIKISSDKFRSLERNKLDCLEKLALLILKGIVPPKPRKKTRVPFSEKRKRAKNKQHRGDVKKQRSKVRNWD